MDKEFKLKAYKIKDIATGFGGCFATDMITVEGRKVGYMYKDEPSYPEDSGWCFMSGDETQEYMDNSSNHAIYDVNTIANYDPEVAQFLEAPIGAVFERNAKGEFAEINE